MLLIRDNFCAGNKSNHRTWKPNLQLLFKKKIHMHPGSTIKKAPYK